MNAPVSREFLVRMPTPLEQTPSVQVGSVRYVWDSSFGPIVIEVIGSSIYVNGAKVRQTRQDTLGA